jgi:cysteine desulfurase / selenocysteine lyase
MNTNNTINPGFNDFKSDLNQNLLPDENVIAAMAAEYFPEFNKTGFSENDFGKDTGSFESVSGVKSIDQNPDFNESIYIDAASKVLEAENIQNMENLPELIENSDKYHQSMQNETFQYSFFEDAGTIFNDTEAENKTKHETQSKIPENKNIPILSDGGFKEISFPQIDGAVIKNESFKKFTTPGFLNSINSLESGTYKGLIIEPVVIPEMDFTQDFFDVAAVRRDFPILSEKVNGKNLIWLDNAATTQKPKQVIDRLIYFYEHENSNVHRGAHTLAARSTDAYEGARDKAAKFLNAHSSKNIVFVRGTTEGINLVAQSWAKYNLKQNDQIVISHLEHHANIVPWQMICSETGAKLCVIPVDDRGQIILSEYEKLLGPKTKLVSVTQVSNALGTVTPVAEIIEIAHRYGAKVLIDGAQSVSHMKVDVQSLDADFFVFSGHKIFGPTGIGVLYGKEDILNSMKPYQGGGNMIADVTFERTIYQGPPSRFEAGTGNIADAVGLGAALDYVNSIGLENISRYEHNLLEYGMETLGKIPGLKLIGTAKNKASVLSFILDGYSTEEVGNALSHEGIAVRSGHHCAQPILRRLGLESTVRPSLAFYNTCDEIDALAATIWSLKSGRNF